VLVLVTHDPLEDYTMINLDKLVQDAKRSPGAKEAVVFVVQNIALLINDAGGDPDRNRLLMDQLNLRAKDLADSVVDNRDVIAPVPSNDERLQHTHDTAPSNPVAVTDEARQEQAAGVNARDHGVHTKDAAVQPKGKATEATKPPPAGVRHAPANPKRY